MKKQILVSVDKNGKISTLPKSNTGRKKGIFFYGIYDVKGNIKYFLVDRHIAIFTRKKDAIKHKIGTDRIFRIQLTKIKEIEK